MIPAKHQHGTNDMEKQLICQNIIEDFLLHESMPAVHAATLAIPSIMVIDVVENSHCGSTAMLR